MPYDLDSLQGYGADDLPVQEPDLIQTTNMAGAPVPSLVPPAPATFLGLAVSTWAGVAVAAGLAFAAFKFGQSSEEEAADDDDGGDRYERRRARLGATDEYDDEDEYDDDEDDEDDDRAGMRPNRDSSSRADQLAAEISRLQQIHGSPR